MAEGLRSKSTIDESMPEKQEDNLKMQKIQDQLTELLLLAHQDRQERNVIASRLAILESKQLGPPVTSIPISYPTSLPPLPNTINSITPTISGPPQPTPQIPVHPLSHDLTLTFSHFPTPTPTPTQFHQTSTIFKTPFKMDIPRFDGTDVLGWIFKINHFFNFHNTQEEQRISIASFYLDGPDLNWYQRMYKNKMDVLLGLLFYMRFVFVLHHLSLKTLLAHCLS